MELARAIPARSFPLRLITAIKDEAGMHGFVLCYLLIGMAAAVVLGVPHKSPTASGLTILCMAVVLFGLGTAYVMSWKANSAGVPCPELSSGLLLLVSWAFFMDTFVALKAMLPDMVPFHADRLLMEWDRLILGDHAWRVVLPIVPDRILIGFESFYFLGWTSSMVVSLLLAALSPKLRHLRAQYFWSHFVTWVVLGNLFAAAFMSVGPILFDQVAGDDFKDLNAYLAQWAPWSQHGRGLGIKAIQGHMNPGVAISAFPSMHVAQATLLVLLARGLGPRAVAVSVTILLLTLLGSVILGWHYAVDGLFSIPATIAIWWVVDRILRQVRPDGRQEAQASSADSHAT